MKTLIASLVLLLLLIASGCVSAPKPVAATFTVPAESVEKPPRKGDYLGAYAFAHNRAETGDHAQAKHYYELAVQWLPKGGTADGEYEREVLVNAAWMALLSGDRSGAMAIVERATSRETYAPPSERLDALRAALLRDASTNLSPAVKSAAGI